MVKILYADDIKEFRDDVKRTLEELIPNCEVTCVEDGDDVYHLGLKRKLGQFDFLLLDENMNDLNGTKCLEILRQLNRETPPVAIFTSEPEKITGHTAFRKDLHGETEYQYLVKHIVDTLDVNREKPTPLATPASQKPVGATRS